MEVLGRLRLPVEAGVRGGWSRRVGRAEATGGGKIGKTEMIDSPRVHRAVGDSNRPIRAENVYHFNFSDFSPPEGDRRSP